MNSHLSTTCCVLGGKLAARPLGRGGPEEACKPETVGLGEGREAEAAGSARGMWKETAGDQGESSQIDWGAGAGNLGFTPARTGSSMWRER